MSDAVTLTLRAPIDRRLDLSGLAPDRLAGLDEGEIARLTVWAGRDAAPVGDFFQVQGGRSADVRIEGSTDRIDSLGHGMSAGRLLIVGDAGSHVAAAMAGGSVVVRGSVADAAGAGMSGGTLQVSGSAGDRLGTAPPGASKGMQGGEIVIGGSAGREAASRCRRGLVVIGGSAGAEPGRAMIAGTLLVLGAVGAGAGRGSRRGSIVAAGSIDVPETYAYACTFEPPYVRLLFHYLRARYGVRVHDRVMHGRYRRFCGDVGHPGKGEILVYDE